MSNHLHLIVQSSAGKLSSLIRDIKAFSAKKILTTIKEGPESRSDWMLKRLTGATLRGAAMSNNRNEGMQFWKYGNHPEEIYSEKFFWNKLNRAAFRYIHMNPVRAKLVYRASDYMYSSASNYIRNEGLIDIELMLIPKIDAQKTDWTREIDNW